MVPSGAFESKRKVSVSIFASCWIKGALCSLGEEIEILDFNIENVNEVSSKGSKDIFLKPDLNCFLPCVYDLSSCTSFFFICENKKQK